MKKQLLRIVATSATVSAVLVASAGAHAATVTLTGWAYGHGNAVQATGYSGAAGAFTGSLTGAGTHDTPSFLTYCIELEEHFAFGNTAMTGYQVVDGASYFARRRADADIADRLGRLMTYVASLASPGVDSTASSGLQLAIWNMVYDADYSVTTAGRFSDTSSLRAVADSFLAGAQTVGTSRYSVYALEKVGSQDFLLLASNGVPEPGSLALTLAALGGLGVAYRRRGRRSNAVASAASTANSSAL